MASPKLPEAFEVISGPFHKEVVYRSIWTNLSRMALPSLPRELADCNQLQVVTATDNNICRIDSLPPSVVRLFLSNNALATLDPMPPGIWELRVEGNRIRKLENLPPALLVLHAELNCIEELDETTLPPYLRELHLQGNPVCRNPDARKLIEDVNSGRRAERFRKMEIVTHFLSCCPLVSNKKTH